MHDACWCEGALPEPWRHIAGSLLVLVILVVFACSVWRDDA